MAAASLAFRSFASVIVLVLALESTANDSLEPPGLHVLAGRTMGTTYAIKFAPWDAPAPDHAPEQIETRTIELLERINRLMSTYLPDSELSLFNQCDHTRWFPVSHEVAEVFQKARSISELSGGAFDVTVGPLVDLWGFGPNRPPRKIPEPAEIARLLRQVGYGKISVRSNPPGIRKEQPEIRCDLSAIAKGYAVDQVAEYLESIGVESFLVEIGGEIRAKGRNPSGKWWQIGIQDPNNSKAIRRTIPLRDRSMATSGDYAQGYVLDGRRISHTIDPRTGRPVTHGLASVTVIHPSCAMADGWATALSVLGPERGFDLARKQHLAVLMLVRSGTNLVEKLTPELAGWIQEP